MNTAELSDEEIFARVKSGEQSLFEVIVRRHNQKLYRTIRGLVRDDHEAEDVLQQAYVSMFTHAGAFRGEAKLSTWLTRIAINEALARIGRRGRQNELAIVGGEKHLQEHPTRSPEEEVSLRELTGFLERAIDALPDTYRLVFVLREVEELSTEETASALELSEEAVRVRLHRARAMLREGLDKRLGEASAQIYGFDGARCDRIVDRVRQALEQTARTPIRLEP